MLKKAIFCANLIGASLSAEIAHDELREGTQENRFTPKHQSYNRYQNDHARDNRAYENRRAVNNEIIDEGYLINNPYNSDVEYTQPGENDDFENVYQQNNQ